MRAKLLNCLPSMRWIPHDIPESSSSSPSTSNPHSTHRIRFTRKPPLSSTSTKEEARRAARFPPHHRKSTLSLTSIQDADSSAVRAKTAPQLQSAFFGALPLEIRRLVYEYVVGEGEVVHLTLGVKRRYGHFLCDADQIGGRVGIDCGCRVLVGGRESRRLEQSALAMVRVCRRMYSEAISSLYRPHTFSLLHITHLLYLPSRLPTPRLNNIRTLRLRWAIRALPFLRRPIHSSRYAYREDTDNWIRVWKMLADMRGLRDLYIVITDPSPQALWQRNWCELEGKLLEPVKQVMTPRWFILCLPYSGCRTDWDMGDCGVELRKPNGGGLDDDEQ
ncbi:hypothetical protein K491DRAFT_608311 [Lophiostoma macrostomum CBS 122681]|uniref:DUF7730 domain-containing protein n=1 Tax=Lophiostoma macrostomum CBS 122681 TaxID=1314788 RepID=A0A6A6SVW4_9PLEO|nr:hypothetical protein K491DRAFT_608311 [Lophiostoma macrostomum CBS 122681]